MTWYKTGTVAVTPGSNAVIGTSTSFIANSRVGDAFRGPDGGWYEVTNIASDTALSIAPDYQGAAVSAGSYSLAPMQGYVKDSADALRALVNTYGAKLAALGTTGNYDVLPPSKGGTGLDDLSVFILTLLSNANAAEGRETLSAAKSGANTDITSLGGLTNPLSVAQGGTGIADLSAFIQTLLNDADAAAGRVTLGAAKSGANTDITSLGGLTTTLTLAQGGTGVTTMAALLNAVLAAGGYGKSNVLGTVSQASGVPTGAIMESGSNSNGHYVKFFDGTMICRGAIPTTALAANGVTGIGITTAAAFINSFWYLVGSGQPSLSADFYGMVYTTGGNNQTTSTITTGWRNGATAQNLIGGSFIAIGRWY